MSHNSERPYGLQASLALIGRLSNLAIPFIIAFEVWQTSELNKLRDNDTRILEWKEAIPQRMRTETEKLRLEITSSVASTFGVTLTEIQKGQVRLEVAIEEIKRRLSAEREHALNSR